MGSFTSAGALAELEVDVSEILSIRQRKEGRTIKAVKNGESPQKTEVLAGALIPRASVPFMRGRKVSHVYTQCVYL